MSEPVGFCPQCWWICPCSLSRPADGFLRTIFLKCRLDTALIRRYEERRLGRVFERPPNLVAPSAKLFRSRLTPTKTEANSLLISFPAVWLAEKKRTADKSRGRRELLPLNAPLMCFTDAHLLTHFCAATGRERRWFRHMCAESSSFLHRHRWPHHRHSWKRTHHIWWAVTSTRW